MTVCCLFEHQGDHCLAHWHFSGYITQPVISSAFRLICLLVLTVCFDPYLILLSVRGQSNELKKSNIFNVDSEYFGSFIVQS